MLYLIIFEGQIVFEGEYLNDERKNEKEPIDKNLFTGKVKLRDNNGKIRFKGEYLNGKRNGKGQEYNKFGKLIFKGEYLNGKRNGKGK